MTNLTPNATRDYLLELVSDSPHYNEAKHLIRQLEEDKRVLREALAELRLETFYDRGAMPAQQKAVEALAATCGEHWHNKTAEGE